MKKLLLLLIIIISPDLVFGQCACQPTWPLASGAGDFTSNDGGICVNDSWTGFITDNTSVIDICVTSGGNWSPASGSLPANEFIGNFDLEINEGGIVNIIDGNPLISIGGKLKNHGGSFITNTTGSLTFLDSVINKVGVLDTGLIDCTSGTLLTKDILNLGNLNLDCPTASLEGKLINNGGGINLNISGVLTFLDSVINNVGLLGNGLLDCTAGTVVSEEILNLCDINLACTTATLGGKILNDGGSFIVNSSGALTFLDSLINNIGLLNNGLIDLSTGTLLTQNLFNSGILNLSCDGIEILGASNIGTINIDQDEIDVTLLRQKGDGSNYLTSPIEIDLLNNFGTVQLLGERVVEVGLGSVWNNNGSDAVFGLDVLGDAGLFLNGGTCNNTGGARMLLGYFQNAFGHFINTATSTVVVEAGFLNNGEFTNGGYIHVGGDLQFGVPEIELLPFENNNQIVVDGDIYIFGRVDNEGVISTEFGLFEEGFEKEVTSFIGGLLTTILELFGEDFLQGDGIVWLGTEPANIFDISEMVTTGASGIGVANNTLVVGLDPESPALGVFPVKLVSLKGKQLERRINVSWEATEYENFDKFLLEKSNNAVNFEGIARIDKSFETIYNHDDYNPKEGVNYYRLKLIDSNGKYTYSKTIAVNYEIDGDYFTFENPVRNHTIQIRTNIKDSELRILDVTGRNIPYDIYDTAEGYEVRPQRTSEGVLLVSMAGERRVFTKKALIR
ncbi:hypothetical protein [uncultured Arcticibacterium sp.]|uniref:hypothetical protein n=1 Tax=uncultured Arcticibacterium sp. TaxID=2173042 RepID=UPI0030F9DD72